MEWIIYKHTNKINGKVYIGQTKQTTTERWRSGNGYKNNIYFYHSILKYGWDNFDHEILEKNILSVKQANEREIYYIKKYDSYKNGYNLTSGGDNRDHLGIPVLQIDVNSLEIVNTYQTIRFAEETTGIDHSQISRCCLRNKKDIQAGGFYWCFQNEWYDGWTPKKRTPPATYNKKEIYQIDKSLNIVSKYESILDAEKTTGINHSTIGQCCRGKNISAGGYYWCYTEDYDNFIPLNPLDEKPVARINKADYNDVKFYDTIADAAEKNNIKSQELIGRCCSGKQISAGGYFWCYQEDYNLNWQPRRNGNYTKVVCVETGIVYNSIKEAIKQTGASSAIKRCLKHPELKSGGYHWCLEDDFKAWKPTVVENKSKKKIICIETKKIYDSMIEAAKEYSILPSELSRACSNSALTAKGLHWSYLENYNDNYVIKEKQIPKHGMKYVQCIETQKVYSSIADASRDTSVDVSSIIRVCKSKALTAGGYHWRYVEK